LRANLNDDAGLITIWNDSVFAISLWRSVFERRAPASIERVEMVIAPTLVGNGNTIGVITDELLDALSGAYREAARGPTG